MAKMALLRVLCLLVVVFPVALASCPSIPVVQTFDSQRYAGTWYEYERFDIIFEWYTRCVSDTYIPRGNGNYDVLYNRIGTWSGQNKTTLGALDIVNGQVPGRFIASFSDSWIPGGNYDLIDTDYDTYSLVYTCADLGITTFDVAWIMTRTRGVLNDEVKNRLYSKLRQHGVDPSRFIVSIQTGC